MLSRDADWRDGNCGMGIGCDRIDCMLFKPTKTFSLSATLVLSGRVPWKFE